MALPINLRGLWRAARGAAAAAVMAFCAVCNYGEVRVVAPAAVGRGPLTLSIQSDPEDTGVARELGWARGIPSAEVTVSPGANDTATGPPVAVLLTDSTGAASVPDLADGNYIVEVLRLLTSAEAVRLAPTEDVIGFMAKQVVTRGSVTLPVPASRRHSVVISEWAFNWGNIPGVGTYMFGGFLELANNADTTVYLDGLVIGEGIATSAELYSGMCAGSADASNDPDGIWTGIFNALPGTGHDYPLAPGATAVIATDAIDHSGTISGGLDLSHANFEFIGTADVDNPGVPNTIDIGLRPEKLSHGMITSQILSGVTFVALPVDVAALPMTPGHDYVRVPRARILDAVALLSKIQFSGPLCPQLVHRNFDRYRGRFMESGWNWAADYLVSVQRKVAYTRPDGRKILQHTRTTNADFFVGPRTAGQLP